MGYTHYWTPKVATPKKWKEYVAACKKLHKNLPDDIKIAGGMGDGKPEFTQKMVWFNGRGDLSHETFCIEPEKLEWDFCKTACKPYDVLVVACLMAAHDILGYEVSSDGDFDDWKDGIEFYKDTLFGDSQKGIGIPEFLKRD